MRSVVFTVRGVTFEGRQEVLARMLGNEPIKIVPEPENQYDPNALAVYVALSGEVLQVGYVPKERAAEIALLLDGESVVGEVNQKTGGFVKANGELASYGLQVVVDFPDPPPPADMSAGWEV
jgi:hypothetical protein